MSSEDLKFEEVAINDYKYLVNCEKDLSIKFLNFENALPKYNEEFGVHIEIRENDRSDVEFVVPIGPYVANGMLMPKGNDASNDAYAEFFIEEKTKLVEKLVTGTYGKGFKSPSPVQMLSIPPLIQGRDGIFQSKSGTGKTHAFLFGMLWGFDPNDRYLQYIFITSTHEIAKQIHSQVVELLPDNAKVALCIGQGSSQQTNDSGRNTGGGFKQMTMPTSRLQTERKSIHAQRDELKTAQVIVATIGKLHSMLFHPRMACLDTKYLKGICIDEYDNILEQKSRNRGGYMGTDEQIMEIFTKAIPEENETRVQRAFFSATMSPETLDAAFNYLRPTTMCTGDPFVMLLPKEDLTLGGIRQYYIRMHHPSEKFTYLMDILKFCRIDHGIIFVNQVETAEKIYSFLLGENDAEIKFSCRMMHGKLSPQDRDTVYSDFAKGKFRLLIATNILARGVDIQTIKAVINYDMPDTYQTYVHRVGRSGRFGRKGAAVSFILEDEMMKVKQINELSASSPIIAAPEDVEKLVKIFE